MLSSIVDLTIIEFCVIQLDEWVLCRIYNNIKNNTQDKSCSLVKGKEKKDKTCSTYLHHGDRNARNQPMPKVDPTTVIVEDYMNQSHQNVPAFSHMASRFPDQFILWLAIMELLR